MVLRHDQPQRIRYSAISEIKGLALRGLSYVYPPNNRTLSAGTHERMRNAASAKLHSTCVSRYFVREIQITWNF